MPAAAATLATPGPRAVRHARALALVCLGNALVAPPTPAAGLSEEESAVFMAAGRCALCHDTSARALRDARGTDLAVVADWRSTMMANSFRDPLWRAKVEREIEDNPPLKPLLEDKCTRCHAPMPHAQGCLDGAAKFTLARADGSGLAGDGVSCTLCHQIQADGLGQHRSFTGGYVIGRDREIFGPYRDVFPMPMRNHVDYTPLHGAHVQSSGFCATCHTLFTPVLDGAGKVAGEFPEQTPYLEWRASAFAREGTQCQDCHMPRIDEPVRISALPPWLDTKQQPFWRHSFVGGNTLLPAILADHADELGATAARRQFAATAERAAGQLRQATAKLRLNATVAGGELLARVTVTNLTGHKFPTGFPSRRAWLHLKVSAADGSVLFESGAHRDGRLVHEPATWQPHHQRISRPSQTQVYEAVMADAAGQATTTLLRAASYLKDNRLPPRGFRPTGKDAKNVAIAGQAAKDPDFHRNESGGDVTRYRIPLGDKAAGDLTVVAELLYQPLKPSFADHLLAGEGPAVGCFRDYHRTADRTPVVVQKRELRLQDGNVGAAPAAP